jgi:hypothetical protein
MPKKSEAENTSYDEYHWDVNQIPLDISPEMIVTRYFIQRRRLDSPKTSLEDAKKKKDKRIWWNINVLLIAIIHSVPSLFTKAKKLSMDNYVTTGFYKGICKGEVLAAGNESNN